MASDNAPQLPQNQSSGSNAIQASAQNQNASNGLITSATGRSTVFGLNYDGSTDAQDNGQGFFNDPSTGKPYDTRNPNLVGFSLPISVVNSSIGNRWDSNTQQAISIGKYKVQVTAPNGKTVTGPMVDVGPAAWTGNAIDTTLGAANALGLKDNSRLTYSIIGPDGKTIPIKGNNADPNAPINSSAGLTRSYYAGQAMQKWNVDHSPFNLGMRVATPEELDKYEYYLNNGGDPSQIDAKDKLAVALAQDPKFLTRDEAEPIWKELIYDPQQNKPIGQQVQEGIQSIPGMLNETKEDLGSAFNNATQSIENGAGYLWNKLTGQTWNVEGKPNLTLTQDLANNIATNAKGTADGVKGIADFIDGAVNFVSRQGLVGLATGGAAGVNNDADAHNAFKLMQNASARADWAKNAINTAAAGYNAIGQKDLANDIQNATVDPKAAAGTSLAFQTLAPGPLLDAAGAGLAGLIRPTYVTGAVDALGNVTRAEAVYQDAMKGVQTAKQAMGNATTPLEFSAAKDAHDVAIAAFNDAKATYTQANTDANAAVNAFSKQNAPGGARTAVGVGSKIAANGVNALASVAKGVGDLPKTIGKLVSGGNPGIEAAAGKLVDKAVDWTLYAHTGASGVVAKSIVQNAPKIASPVTSALQVIGKELLNGETSLPFYRRVSQELGETAGGWIAKQLDNPVVYALGNVAGAAGQAAKGAAVGAVMGGVSNPSNPVQSAIQGSAFGGIYGLAGAGMGQWRKFNSPDESLRAAYGDLSRFKTNKLAESQKADFNQLSLPDQIKFAQISAAHPDVSINFFNQPGGESGVHEVDPNGRSIANVNVAGQNPLAPMLAHEVQHALARSGSFQQVYDSILGNPATGKVGSYTALNSQGNPIVDSNGSYETTPEFKDLKQSYTDKLASLGKNPNKSDQEFSQELFAEHGVDYLMSGGHLQEGSAFRPSLYSTADAQNLLGKLGYSFNRSGQVVGTGLFSGLKSDDNLTNIVKSYYKSKNGWKVDSEDIKGPGIISRSEVQADPRILARKLRGAAAIDTDAQGNIIGVKKTSQIDKQSMAMSNFIHERLDAETPQFLLQNGITKDLNPQSKQATYSARSFPEGLLNDAMDHVNASPHYRDLVNTVNRTLADPNQQGNILGFGYYKATNFGKYGSFPYTEREAVPYQMNVTKNENLLVKTADVAQISRNYSMVRDRPDLKGTWPNIDSFSKDVDQYFTNLSRGEHGASNGLGEDKRNKINMLLGIDTNTNAGSNPLSGNLPAKAKPFIKSFRLDRMANVDWRNSLYSFKSQGDYDLANRNYNPMINGGDERITRAALRYNNPQRTYSGYSHYAAHEHAVNAGEDPEAEHEEGFLTNEGRFLGRKDSFELAFERKQLDPSWDRMSKESWGRTLNHKDLLKGKRARKGNTPDSGNPD